MLSYKKYFKYISEMFVKRENRTELCLMHIKFLIALSLLAVVITTLPASASSGGRDDETGVLLLAHGDPYMPIWNQLVENVTEVLHGPFLVDIAFQMPIDLQTPVDRLVARGAKNIIIVPVAISSYSATQRDMDYAFGFRSDPPVFYGGAPRHMGQPYWPVVSTANFTMTKAMDDSTIIAQILRERARDLSIDPRNESLFILAHGPTSDSDNSIWIANMTTLGNYIQERDKYAEVKVGTFQIDGSPELRERSITNIRSQIQASVDAGRRVIVVPLLVSDGYTNRVQFPQFLEGLNYAYDGKTLLPHPWVAKWVKSQVLNEFPGMLAVSDNPPTG